MEFEPRIVRPVETPHPWGDVAPPYARPGGSAQPDIGDISALVSKFGGSTTAPPKMYARLAGDAADPSLLVSVSDISSGVSAFSGQAFHFSGPQACP